MRFEEARARLNEWCQYLDGKPASTNRTVRPEPNAAGRDPSWWLENRGSTPDWRNSRSVAYLCAYMDLGDGRLPMEGLRLDDGYLWPDRAVMRAMLMNGCVSARGSEFVLTERGHALVAPFIKIGDDKISIAMGAR